VTRRIQIERAAEFDIAEITIALRERQPASATKFVKAARTAFRLLATQPEMGRRYRHYCTQGELLCHRATHHTGDTETRPLSS
jgi:plasmid stabilization system protein ParE